MYLKFRIRSFLSEIISLYSDGDCRRFLPPPGIRPLSIASRKVRYVLGIESSADDTGVAIVNREGDVVGEGHNSQIKDHRKSVPAIVVRTFLV